ncbi:MAG: hypothetical protein HPY82_18840 [Gammaproteobacteria bacterium]|nr:hypothetical protein [Gammaproteobacteria bacterium]
MRLAFISLLITFVIGCATTELWNGDERSEYVKVVPKTKDDDVEVVLRDLGKKYYCTELIYSEYPNNKICYVKISEVEGIKIKLLKTPEAILVDMATPIIVIGLVSIASLPSLANSVPRK